MAEKEKFDPVKEFVNLRDSLTRTVEGTIRTVTGMPSSSTGIYPPLDIYETDEQIIIRVAFLNQVKPDSIEISMEKGILTLSGEVMDTLEVEPSAYLQREIFYGKFSRSVSITRAVDSGSASAKFKHNILTISFPKTKQNTPTIVNVTPAD